MQTHGDLSDTRWERLAPLLPSQKPQTGKPNLDHPQILNGILWIKRTGAPWRDLPDCYGTWSPVACRVYRWPKQGIWQPMWETRQQDADAAGQRDWIIPSVDGSIARALRHAAGGSAWALSRRLEHQDPPAGADGRGTPMILVLTVGQRHEAVVLEHLMAPRVWATALATEAGRRR